MMRLTRYRFDNEYHDGLVEDPTGAWFYADEVRAVLKEITNFVEQIEAESMLTCDPLANLDILHRKATELLACLRKIAP